MPTITESNQRKINFTIVGTINAVIDFGILFLLTSLGLAIIPANIVSTSAAFCFSFFANKKYTFKSKSTDIRREAILFTVTTLFGLWIIQGIIIKLILNILDNHLSPNTALFIAKAFGAGVTLLWNYFFYSRVVFKRNKVN